MTARPDPHAAARTTAELLTDRTFGPWFWGNLVSNSGNWLFNVTAAVVVFQLSGSAVLVGMVAVDGAASDAFGPRPALLVAITAACIAVAIAWRLRDSRTIRRLDADGSVSADDGDGRGGVDGRCGTIHAPPGAPNGCKSNRSPRILPAQPHGTTAKDAPWRSTTTTSPHSTTRASGSRPATYGPRTNGPPPPPADSTTPP